MNCIYHKGTILAVILLSVMAISCGILEDRDECPCVITFKAIDLPSYECKPVIYIYDSGQMKERIEVPAGMLSEGYIHNLERRRYIDLYIWCDTTGISFPAFTFDMPSVSADKGKELPALFFSRYHLDTREESVTVNIDFHKRFAKLQAKVFADKEVRSVKITGNNAGYYIDGQISGNSLEIDDISNNLEDGYVSFSARIPQQTDDGLEIILEYEDGNETIRLGQLLDSKGYNWEAEDLMDIDLIIEGRNVTISLKAEDWKDGASEEITI